MTWDEFRDLLTGIGPDTPLGRIVSVRAENDKEVLKQFSSEQRRIRNEWRSHHAQKMSPGSVEDVLNTLKNAFVAMSGQG